MISISTYRVSLSILTDFRWSSGFLCHFTPCYLHVFNTYSLCHFTLFIMTQLVCLNVLISLYEFYIWLDGNIWWKFCDNRPLRNPLTDKNDDVSNTYYTRCTYFLTLPTSCLSLKHATTTKSSKLMQMALQILLTIISHFRSPAASPQ